MKPLPRFATVRSWDPDTGAGSALTDDGQEIEWPPAAFDASGLRALRPGQRIRLAWRDGQVILATIATLP